MVNVGLVTSSSAAAPRAAAIPFTSVVLPAPTSPRRITNIGGVSISAIRSPSSKVPSTDSVLNRRSLTHAPRKSKSFHHHPSPDSETHPTDASPYPSPAPYAHPSRLPQSPQPVRVSKPLPRRPAPHPPET